MAAASSPAKAVAISTSHQYLEQVHRAALDFDLERICSETMATRNVYACCVCGKYCAGRSEGTPAWKHAAELGHRVWVLLDQATLWLLPEGVKIESAALEDMVQALAPTFTAEQVQRLPGMRQVIETVDGSSYLPGFVGMSNLGHSDYMAAVVQVLCHAEPLRNACLLGTLDACTSGLVQAFARLMRRLWSSHNYKSTCSPLEFAHAVSAASNGKFRADKPADAGTFAAWLLNTLHRDVQKAWPKVGGKRQRPAGGTVSLIVDCFAGSVQVTTHAGAAAAGSGDAEPESTSVYQMRAPAAHDSVAIVPAFMVALDLPVATLRKTEDGESIVPSVPLQQLLYAKFGKGVTHTDAQGVTRSYRLVKLPPYLVLNLRRFSANDFFLEKNNTVVSLPDKFLNMAAFTEPAARAAAELPTVPALLSPDTPLAALKAAAAAAARAQAPGSSAAQGALERADLVSAAAPHVLRATTSLYDLAAVVVHTSPASVEEANTHASPLEAGHYVAHALHDATSQWYQLDDVAVSESYAEAITLAPTQLLLYRHRGWCPNTLAALERQDQRPLQAIAEVLAGQ